MAKSHGLSRSALRRIEKIVAGRPWRKRPPRPVVGNGHRRKGWSEAENNY